MKWGKYRFGSIKIDGKAYEKDVVLDQGGLRKRKKKPSREYRDQFGHTPVSLKEAIPWRCQRLLIGTGMHGRLPVMDEVLAEAQRRGVEIVVCPTAAGHPTPSGKPGSDERDLACDLLTPLLGRSEDGVPIATEKKQLSSRQAVLANDGF